MKYVFIAVPLRGSKVTEHPTLVKSIINVVAEHGYTITSDIEAAVSVKAWNQRGLLTDAEQYSRDIKAIDRSDLLIAEISAPSAGVGYQISYALHRWDLPVLCLCRFGADPSAMLLGNHRLTVAYHRTEADIRAALYSWLVDLHPSFNLTPRQP